MTIDEANRRAELIACGRLAFLPHLSEDAEAIRLVLDDREEAHKHLAWIRRKLGLPEDAKMFEGQSTIAGEMHVVCSNAHGYKTYILAFKCNDKQGEIARLTVKAAKAKADRERLKDKLESCEASHDDEEAAHQETLLLWQQAKADRERLARVCERLQDELDTEKRSADAFRQAAVDSANHVERLRGLLKELIEAMDADNDWKREDAAMAAAREELSR